jgi:antitoxin component YwqK of YwqJK toxin-antitoxin module
VLLNHKAMIRIAAAAVLSVVAACSRPDGLCGDGVLRGQGPPSGTLTWCARSDGTKHGAWTEWYSTGTIKTQGQYVDGKMDGLWTTFQTDGNKLDEGQYRAGRKVGTWTTWDDEDGSLQRESEHRVDSDEVTWTAFRPDGTKRATGTSRGGQEYGPYQEWHGNGKLAAEGTYERGQKVGVWSYWDADGNSSITPQGGFADKQP